MPVREGGLTEELKEANSSAHSTNATMTTSDTSDNVHKRKRDTEASDIRQDWATFLKTSVSQFPQKKKARGPDTTSQSTGAAAATSETASSQSARPSSTREYMFKLPDFSGVDLKSIDVVLISNYNHILALPYLTEFTEFQGRIFATEPTIEFGRQLMTEFSTFFGTGVSSAPHEVIDRKKLVTQSGSGLYPAYTHGDIKACIDKIQPVRFREHIALYGSLKLTAHSAGYCLGGGNWLIQIGTENIAYISSSSTQINLHPDLFDGSLLEHASTVIAADLRPTGSLTYDTGVNEVCASIARTVARKGHVLIPCTISGFLFDLLEDVHLHLTRMGLEQQVQYSFVSPVADTALQYSNILAEWMAPRKQEMVYLPEAPLLHGILLEKGTAKNYKSVHGAFSNDLKYPCIAFGGHPSLRSGPMVNLLHMWGKKDVNSIVFIEPRIDVPASLEPFEGLQISRSICPLDIRLSIDQLVEVLKKHKHPKHVLVPFHATASTSTDGSAELADSKGTTSTSSLQWSAYKVGEAIQLGMGSLYETVLLSEEVGAVDPVITESGEDDDGEADGSSKVPEVMVEFTLEGLPACIIVREGETIVKCDDSIRPLLREPVLKCLQAL
ncbi:Integrator complex subunit 9 [Mortierella sp. GBA43]|nr:Integrator complex subunit 9 [Mortierella sp. GBA43]